MPDPIQSQLSQPAELHRYCRRCHRRLKALAAMKAGYGRICLAKSRQERAGESENATT
jgi:hypothetical protein